MSTHPDVNYAQYSGIHSLAGAIVFAILYAPLFAYFLWRAIRNPTYVFIILTFFCIVRVTAFILRAILAGSDSAGHNLNLLIAAQIVYNVGFFGLLYSAYTLVLDREDVTDAPRLNNPITRITRNRAFIRLVLTAAISLGISGACQANLSSTPYTIQVGDTLRKVSIYIFLAVTILLGLQTFLLIGAELSVGNYKERDQAIGVTHGIYILSVITLLLLAREVFFAATADNLKQQENEHLWYPLAALTELLAVVLFATRGLVPNRKELPS